VTGTRAVAGANGLVERISKLLGGARRSGAVVVHLQNDGPPGAVDEAGTAGWQLHLPAHPGANEIVIRKAKDDGFDATGLGDFLAERNVTSIAVCGVTSEMCILATARTALDRGYRVVLPHDAHSTYDIPAMPEIGDVVPAAAVSRVAEWALGDEIEIVARAADVRFTAPVSAVIHDPAPG
jgi:streptothricin hydrolase